MSCIEIDCLKLSCPEPVILCHRIIDSQSPEHLRVLVDNFAAYENVTRLLSNRGYIVKSVEDNSIWAIEGFLDAEKFAQATALNVPNPSSSNNEDSQKILVLITTKSLGRGDDTLGLKLMEAFISNLNELSDNLWRIIFLNGGVKLVAENDICIKALKNLEKSNVDIFVCGACLMHYNLVEQKQVGQTTNMLDILTSLSLADKIIRP